MRAAVLDLFAGPGGWSQALRDLGVTELGIDNDRDTCATATAAAWPMNSMSSFSQG